MTAEPAPQTPHPPQAPHPPQTSQTPHPPHRRRIRLALAAAVVGVAAVLAAGYAAAGSAGLVDTASVAAVGVLIVARGTVRGQAPLSVRPKITSRPAWLRRPARGAAAEFPGYQKIFSDLAWAQVSWRHYEHPLRPMLARLAAALDREPPADPPPPHDPDGPGPSLAALDRVIADLERLDPEPRPSTLGP